MKLQSPFRLTFLGTGTSTGVPMVNCSCSVCTSPKEKNKRLRSSILLESPATTLLIDSGPDLRQQCLTHKITHLDAIVYTHAHMDHILGFDELRRFTIAKEASLPIYGSKHTLQQLLKIYYYAFNSKQRFTGYIKPKAQTISPYQLFTIGDISLRALPVHHGSIPTFAYQITYQEQELITYIPDCKTIPKKTLQYLKSTHTLILDALRPSRHPTHMNLEEARAIHQLIQPQQSYYTHLSHDIDHDDLSKQLELRESVAYDSLCLKW